MNEDCGSENDVGFVGGYRCCAKNVEMKGDGCC